MLIPAIVVGAVEVTVAFVKDPVTLDVAWLLVNACAVDVAEETNDPVLVDNVPEVVELAFVEVVFID